GLVPAVPLARGAGLMGGGLGVLGRRAPRKAQAGEQGEGEENSSAHPDTSAKGVVAKAPGGLAARRARSIRSVAYGAGILPASWRQITSAKKVKPSISAAA